MSKKSKIRDNFREAVFKRDGHKCRICKRSDVKLDSHHITDRSEMPNGGYVKENGITLCDCGSTGCHMKAEKYHISGGTEWEPGMHPDDLYKLIGSSKELAVQKSLIGLKFTVYNDPTVYTISKIKDNQVILDYEKIFDDIPSYPYSLSYVEQAFKNGDWKAIV